MVNLKTTHPQIAAISDPEADGSIGNVVAANAIGVFLGLGFPWLVAAIYWDQVETNLRHFTKFLGRPQHRICGSFRRYIFYGETLSMTLKGNCLHVISKGDDVHDCGSLWTWDSLE